MTSADKSEAQEPATRPRGRSYRNVRDARSVSMLGIGMIIGAVIGAGVTLLVAPQSGLATRKGVSKRVRSLGRGRNAWARLGRELRRAAAARQKAAVIEAKRQEIRARAANLPGI